MDMNSLPLCLTVSAKIMRFNLSKLKTHLVPLCVDFSHGGRDPHRAWATSLWMLYCTRLAGFADCLLVNLLLSSQQFLSHCNPVESLLVFLASRWQCGQPFYNKNLLFFLFRSASPSIVSLHLIAPFPSKFLFLIFLSSIFLSLIASSQGGYAAYRYAQPAAVATPAAAAAAAAAYSDRWASLCLDA